MTLNTYKPKQADDELEVLKEKNLSVENKDVSDFFEHFYTDNEKSLDVNALADYFIASGKYQREQIEGMQCV